MLQDIDTTIESVPRPGSVVTEHLRDILDLKALAMEVGKNDFVGRIRMKNILRQENALREELCAAEIMESPNDLEVTIAGAPVKDHMIEVDFFGGFLKCVREVVDRIAFAAGISTPVTGKISADSPAENRLMVAGRHESLFTVHFRLTPTEDCDDSLIAEQRTAALRDMRILFDNDTSKEDLTILVRKSALKEPYNRLLKTIADQEAIVKFRTKAHPYSVTLSAEAAAERMEWMDVPEKETKDILDVEGILEAGNIRSHTFQIRTIDSFLYKGAVSMDAQEQMKIKLGALVRARIERTIQHNTKTPSKSTRPVDILQSIRVLDEGKAKNETLFE